MSSLPGSDDMDILAMMRGWRNRANGDYWEKVLTEIFMSMWTHGDARILKTPEPLRVIGRTQKPGVFQAIFSAKGQPDYTGTLRSGKSVMIEAKFSNSDRITQDRVLDAQAKLLSEHEQLGAKCGIAVCLNFDAFGFIPWEDWINLKAITGHRYVSAADLKAHGWELAKYNLVASMTAALTA